MTVEYAPTQQTIQHLWDKLNGRQCTWTLFEAPTFEDFRRYLSNSFMLFSMESGYVRIENLSFGGEAYIHAAFWGPQSIYKTTEFADGIAYLKRQFRISSLGAETPVANHGLTRLMKRLGFYRDGDSFRNRRKIMFQRWNKGV